MRVYIVEETVNDHELDDIRYGRVFSDIEKAMQYLEKQDFIFYDQVLERKKNNIIDYAWVVEVEVNNTESMF